MSPAIRTCLDACRVRKTQASGQIMVAFIRLLELRCTLTLMLIVDFVGGFSMQGTRFTYWWHGFDL